MIREIKFKGISKSQKNYGRWVFGICFDHRDIGFCIINKLGYCIVVDAETICQLITTINGNNIYEYSCFYDKLYINISYLQYSGDGILRLRCFNILDKGFTPNFLDGMEATPYHQYHFMKNLIYVGNWHDGKETILNKIKELK